MTRGGWQIQPRRFRSAREQPHPLQRPPHPLGDLLHQVPEHAKQGGFPANRVSEVRNIIDPTTAESVSGGRIRQLRAAAAAAYTAFMRTIGTADRSEIELDPVRAYRRGQLLDAMLAAAAPVRARGVIRGTHAHFNRLDAERQLQAARTLNHP